MKRLSAITMLAAGCSIPMRIEFIDTPLSIYTETELRPEFTQAAERWEQALGMTVAVPGEHGGIYIEYCDLPSGVGGRTWYKDHICIAERMRQQPEVCRVQVMTHELGHMLGAHHCEESDCSVMRPTPVTCEADITEGDIRAVKEGRLW